MKMDELVVTITTKKPAHDLTENELQRISDGMEEAELESVIFDAVYKALLDYQLDTDLDFVVNS